MGRTWFRRALLVAIAVIALCGGARLLSSFDTPGDRGLSRAKLDHWRAHLDDYDVVFVGSSRVYRNVDPLRFDEGMARAGRPTRSFDLGLPGMTFLEALHTAHATLDARPSALATLVVELLPAAVDILGRNAESARVRAWHDARTTLAAARLAATADGSLAERLDAALQHAALGLRRAFHQGRAVARTIDVLEGSYDADVLATLAPMLAGRGHLALEDDPDPLVAARRARFLDDPDALRARTASFLAGAGDDDDRTSSAALELLADLARRAAALDVRLVLLGMPVHRRFEAERAAVAAGALPAHLLVLADPIAHPLLYDPQRRFDLNHLDRVGTAALTDLLVERMADILAD